MFLMEFSLRFFYLVRLNDADQVKINWRGELFSLALENSATQKSVNYFVVYSKVIAKKIMHELDVCNF